VLIACGFCGASAERAICAAPAPCDCLDCAPPPECCYPRECRCGDCLASWADYECAQDEQIDAWHRRMRELLGPDVLTAADCLCDGCDAPAAVIERDGAALCAHCLDERRERTGAGVSLARQWTDTA